MCNGVDVKAVEQLAKCRENKTEIWCIVGLPKWGRACVLNQK